MYSIFVIDKLWCKDSAKIRFNETKIDKNLLPSIKKFNVQCSMFNVFS